MKLDDQIYEAFKDKIGAILLEATSKFTLAQYSEGVEKTIRHDIIDALETSGWLPLWKMGMKTDVPYENGKPHIDIDMQLSPPGDQQTKRVITANIKTVF